MRPMVDPIAVGAGMAGASHAVNIIRGVIGALRETGKAEVINQVMELQITLNELIDKNRVLAEQNRELQAKLDLKAKVHFRKPFCFQEGRHACVVSELLGRHIKANPLGRPNLL